MARRKYFDLVIRGVTYADDRAAARALGRSVSAIQAAVREGRLETVGLDLRSKPVTIRGVTYPSRRAAAQALGITDSSVTSGVRNGSLHRVGTGRVGAEPLPVRIRGKDFRTAKDAAKHFGVKVATIYSAIDDGDPDRVGRGLPPCMVRAVPFRIGGLTFPSHAAASRALGFKRDEYVSKTLRNGSKRGREKILAAAMRYAARQEVRRE